MFIGYMYMKVDDIIYKGPCSINEFVKAKWQSCKPSAISSCHWKDEVNSTSPAYLFAISTLFYFRTDIIAKRR